MRREDLEPGIVATDEHGHHVAGLRRPLLRVEAKRRVVTMVAVRDHQRPRHGRERELLGELWIEAGVDGSPLEAFYEQENIRGSAARHACDGIDLALVVDPRDRADG